MRALEVWKHAAMDQANFLVDFPDRASEKDVLGLRLPVARVEDVLQGKIWAATDKDRRPSKRRKDLLDIERLVEAFPHLESSVPPDLLDKLR
jgi:hypothetical protein